MSSEIKPFTLSKRVALRNRMEVDVNRYVYWQTHGEWLTFDAPWESFGNSLTSEQEQKIRVYFSKTVREAGSILQRHGMIVHLAENRIIGTVNRYMNERFKGVFYVGISIREDQFLNQGLGTEAFGLWVDYLFKNSGVHKIECHTWSLNPRMMRVAEKLGFQLEGRERELIYWQEEWLDRLRFGLLRQEWHPPYQNEKITKNNGVDPIQK